MSFLLSVVGGTMEAVAVPPEISPYAGHPEQTGDAMLQEIQRLAELIRLNLKDIYSL